MENDRRENESPVHNTGRKETKRCKYCSRKRRIGRTNCPAFGKRCSACGIMHHFVSQRMAKANVNVVERESGSDDECCLTLDSLDESEILCVHSCACIVEIHEMDVTSINKAMTESKQTKT